MAVQEGKRTLFAEAMEVAAAAREEFDSALFLTRLDEQTADAPPPRHYGTAGGTVAAAGTGTGTGLSTGTEEMIADMVMARVTGEVFHRGSADIAALRDSIDVHSR
jgi:hypothetical protein